MSDKKKLSLKQLIADLQSTSESTILNALENARSIGTTEVTPLIIKLLLHTNDDIALEAEKIINSLKDSASAPILIEALNDENLKPIRSKIIATFWMSGLDAKPYLTRFVKIGIEGDFLECMEVFSVIDNIDPEDMPQDQAIESLLLLNAHFEKNEADEKNELLKDIAKMLVIE